MGFGNTDPIGKTIIRSGQRHYRIVGVVKDFHFTSARQKIAPLMMIASNNSRGKIIARVQTADIPHLINDIKNKWERYKSGAPFNYSFLDQQFASIADVVLVYFTSTIRTHEQANLATTAQAGAAHDLDRISAVSI